MADSSLPSSALPASGSRGSSCDVSANTAPPLYSIYIRENRARAGEVNAGPGLPLPLRLAETGAVNAQRSPPNIKCPMKEKIHAHAR
jgi:hypothetical protein